MKYLLFLPVLFITACTQPETPAQTVYAIESSYAAGLRIELAYSNLPRCHLTRIPLCSDVAVIKKVQRADNIAYSAIKQAETAVRTQGFNDSKITSAIASAKALTGAFTDITSQLRVK